MTGFLKKLFSFNKRAAYGTGALLDARPEKEREKDYKFEEIVATANPVAWLTKLREAWRSFPIQDQDGSGSCVAQTLKKILGILYWLRKGEYIHFSATHIYQRRATKPQAGMWGTDAFNIAREGVTLELLAPSEKLSDAQMDGAEIEPHKQEVGKIFKIENYVTLPIGDIETIASTIQTTGKALMAFFYFNANEWSREVPIIQNPTLNLHAPTTLRHSVAAIDFFLHEGKKAILIEDSAHFGGLTRRIITEDFFKARNYFVGYPINFVFDAIPDQTQKPRHTFTRDLAFSPTFTTDPDVKALQDILKYEGLFPKNTDSTGYYGAITAKGILAFQKKHKVADDAELDSLGGRIVGKKTRSKLNGLYGN